jgi:hypothetical protein
VSYPDVSKLCKLIFGLFREGGHEEAACDTSGVSDGPTLIFKAVKESFEEVFDEWFECLSADLVIGTHFGAQFRNAVASSFTYGVVISHRLNTVVLADLASVSFNYVSTLLAEYLLPSVNAVNSNSLSDIVPVQAHPGD